MQKLQASGNRRAPATIEPNARRVSGLSGKGHMAQHGEASVEEILESIKKVMARDSAPLRRDEAADRKAADVLDLAEMELGPDTELATDDDGPLTTDAVRAGMRDNLDRKSVV